MQPEAAPGLGFGAADLPFPEGLNAQAVAVECGQSITSVSDERSEKLHV
jgi:hypothetical protein